ncbi:5979_t:CDS:1, partial [Acaulospora colombiana]
AGAVDSISPLMVNYPNVEWNSSKPYWAAERTRNSLRRVCKPWDQYLRQYNHRFVRMFDVAHGVFPMQHLQSAMRISLGDHTKICCNRCISKDYWLRNLPHEETDGSYQQLCRSIFRRFYPLKVQILDFGNSDSNMLELICSLPPPALRQLVVLQAAYIGELEK